MSKTYKNEKGVYYEGHTDKKGTIHVNIYDNNPQKSHDSIHVNINSTTGKGTIVEKSSGQKSTTSVGCYLTSACMYHYLARFEDNCYELTVLRWFRDNFVSKEEILHYYQMAPLIVDAIEQEGCTDIVYNYGSCIKSMELISSHIK